MRATLRTPAWIRVKLGAECLQGGREERGDDAMAERMARGAVAAGAAAPSTAGSRRHSASQLSRQRTHREAGRSLSGLVAPRVGFLSTRSRRRAWGVSGDLS